MLSQGSAMADRVANSLVAFAAAVLIRLAPLYQPDILPDEPRSRWKKVFDKIGGDAVAVVQGAPQTTQLPDSDFVAVLSPTCEVG